MTEIQKFLKSKGAPQNIEDAFLAYCKTTYAGKFDMNRNGNTIQAFINKMTPYQVREAWNDFLREMRDYLPEQL